MAIALANTDFEEEVEAAAEVADENLDAQAVTEPGDEETTDPDEAVEGDEPTEPYEKSELPTVTEAATHLFGGEPAHNPLLAEISNAELKCKRAEYIVMEKKEELKAAKEEFDGCVVSLRRLCSQLLADADRPLFNQGKGEAVDVAAEAPAATNIEPSAVDNSWREVTIDELNDLSKAVRENLRKGDIANLGELADLIARVESSAAEWPKGIGPVAQEKVIHAINTWQENNVGMDTDSKAMPVQPIAWESISDEMQGQYLEGRAARLRPKTADELTELWGTYGGGEFMAAGADAFQEGDLIINCPYAPTSTGDWSDIDAWIAGWINAEKTATSE